jgi:ABC-2 type transport system permease protein
VNTLAGTGALVSARFRVALQYRAAAAAGVFTQFFFGFVMIMVLEAFYRSARSEPAFSFASAATYVWLGQALFALVPWRSDPEIEVELRQGHVVYALLRPLDLYAAWYARTVAARAAAAALRALPIALGAGLALPALGLEEWAFAAPASPAAGALWALALVLAIALGAALTMLVHVSMLWTLSGEGLSRVLPALVMLGSGMVIPLPLFPDAWQRWLNALPFRALVDVPNRLYTGDIAPAAAPAELALALGWTVALVALGRALLARGLRRLVVQGG